MQGSLVSIIENDLDKRALNGTYIYLFAWLLIGGGTGFDEQHPQFFWIVAILFAFFGVNRLIAYFRSAALKRASHKLWYGMMYVNTLGPALVMGWAFAKCLIDPSYESIFIYMLMAVFALISAGSVSFSPSKALSISYLICLTFPPFVAALFLSEEHTQEGVMLVLYAVFMVVQVSRMNREYLQMIEQQQILKELNNQDPLTQIYNRRFFDDATDLAWKTHMRTGSNLSLMLVDIDHFKSVNDSYGHSAGDEVIRSTAKIISKVCKRDTDIVARIGGEEFAVLVSVSEPGGTEALAEKVRKEIESMTLSLDGFDINITASVGLAHCVPQRTKNTLDLFKEADRCLYDAKDSGRNKVVSVSY